MKVLVPLNNKEQIDAYIEHGAGEFYLGFYDEEWKRKFGEYQDINRMSGYRKDANSNCFEEMLVILKAMKEKKIPTYVTFNSSMYSEEQLAYIKQYFIRLKEEEADGVIVSCAELVDLASKLGLPAVVSTIAGVYNSEIADFYAGLGAKRIILPRDLSVLEIGSIVEKVPHMEFEVFMMRNGCVFSDSNCLGFHRSEMCSVCGTISKAKQTVHAFGNHMGKETLVEENDRALRREFHELACGLCAIYDFVTMGIAAGKIVGRTDESENICTDISIVKQNVEIARQCNSRKQYLERMIWPREKEACKDSFACYYPEMRFS